MTATKLVLQVFPWQLGVTWKHAILLPIALILFALVKRNYRKRAAGRAPDLWYWADSALLRMGFCISTKSLI